jgi:hypothetical protein
MKRAESMMQAVEHHDGSGSPSKRASLCSFVDPSSDDRGEALEFGDDLPDEFWQEAIAACDENLRQATRCGQLATPHDALSYAETPATKILQPHTNQVAAETPFGQYNLADQFLQVAEMQTESGTSPSNVADALVGPVAIKLNHQDVVEPNVQWTHTQKLRFTWEMREVTVRLSTNLCKADKGQDELLGVSYLFGKDLSKSSSMLNSRFSSSFLKSNLQKAVRLSYVKSALRTAVELCRQSVPEFLRRLPIVIMEDALLHPDLPFVVWLMMAVCGQQNYRLSPEHLNRCLRIVHDIAFVKVRDPLPAILPRLPTLDELDTLREDEAALIKALLCRAAYGGMKETSKCSKAMLRYGSAASEATQMPHASTTRHTTRTLVTGFNGFVRGIVWRRAACRRGLRFRESAYKARTYPCRPWTFIARIFSTR